MSKEREFVAQIDEATGKVYWRVDRYSPAADSGWKNAGLHYVPICPCVNPSEWHFQEMARHLGVAYRRVAKMDMIKVGATDRLGDAGWAVYVRN